jgi:hypothetical protein
MLLQELIDVLSFEDALLQFNITSVEGQLRTFMRFAPSVSYAWWKNPTKVALNYLKNELGLNLTAKDLTVQKKLFLSLYYVHVNLISDIKLDLPDGWYWES